MAEGLATNRGRKTPTVPAHRSVCIVGGGRWKPASPERSRAGRVEPAVALMIFLLGCLGALPVGACVYLITLDEMQHRFRAWRAHAEALRRAAVIAGFFVVLSGVLAIVLPGLIVNR